ncbi:hypothetical protein B0H13DRAFT_1863632 [Mycena leptocephala]|nr:hypothetical protein B0H13DRAFT_1863632 [Mycena leptocephala]
MVTPSIRQKRSGSTAGLLLTGRVSSTSWADYDRTSSISLEFRIYIRTSIKAGLARMMSMIAELRVKHASGSWIGLYLGGSGLVVRRRFGQLRAYLGIRDSHWASYLKFNFNCISATRRRESNSPTIEYDENESGPGGEPHEASKMIIHEQQARRSPEAVSRGRHWAFHFSDPSNITWPVTMCWVNCIDYWLLGNTDVIWLHPTPESVRKLDAGIMAEGGDPTLTRDGKAISLQPKNRQHGSTGCCYPHSHQAISALTAHMDGPRRQ